MSSEREIIKRLQDRRYEASLKKSEETLDESVISQSPEELNKKIEYYESLSDAQLKRVCKILEKESSGDSRSAGTMYEAMKEIPAVHAVMTKRGFAINHATCTEDCKHK